MKNQESELEKRHLQLELEIKTAELHLKELELKSLGENKRWSINLSAAQATIIVAVIGVLGSFFGAYLQGRSAQELKRLEFESNLILKAVETGNVEESKKNIQFLLAAGFIQDERGAINKLLESGKYTIRLPSKTSESIMHAAETDDLEGVVREILNQSGLPQNFVLAPVEGIDNASALIDGNNKRVVIYNPLWIAQLKKSTGTNWTVVFVLAHEIGHHLMGHMLQSEEQSNPKIELEADEFSGFVLYRLGASLEDSQRAVSVMADERRSETHPGKEDRLRAVEKGWQRAQEIDKK